jgi:hypothetical protein
VEVEDAEEPEEAGSGSAGASVGRIRLGFDT